MINLKKACAFLLTAAMSGIGLSFNPYSLAMDDEESRSSFSRLLDVCKEQLNFLKEIKNRSLHDVILYYILLDENGNQGEKLYVLPMAEDQSKCMIVNKNLTKCVYFSNQRKVAIFREIPNGYGNEIDYWRKELFRREYHTKETDIWTASVFDCYELNNPNRLFDDATQEMIQLAKEKGIAGYKMDNNRKFCSIF